MRAQYVVETGKENPPAFSGDGKESIQPWRDYNADKRELHKRSHLFFHLKFVEMLGLLSKGDDAEIDLWCRMFLPLEEVVKGVQLPHIFISTTFLRYIDGAFFSAPEDAQGRVIGEDSIDDKGGADSDVQSWDKQSGFFSDNLPAMVAIFTMVEESSRLFGYLEVHQLEESPGDLDSAALSQLAREETTFQTIFLESILPFLENFYEGNWLLDLEAEIEKEGRSDLASPPTEVTAAFTLDHIVRITREIATTLGKIAETSWCLAWSEAHLKILDVLSAMLDKPLSKAADYNGTQRLLIPEDGVHNTSFVKRAIQGITTHIKNLELEGLDGGTDGDIIQRKRKDTMVREAMDVFVDQLFVCIDGGLQKIGDDQASAHLEFMPVIMSFVHTFVKRRCSSGEEVPFVNSFHKLPGVSLQARDIVADDFWKPEVLCAKAMENTDKAEVRFRNEAFEIFHDQSRLFIVNILKHLLEDSVDDYLDSDLFLVRTLEDILKDRRDEIEKTATRESWLRAQLQEEILKNDQITKLIQCALVDMMGPETVIGLISGGMVSRGAGVSRYDQGMVTAAITLGNGMMAGGNLVVQKRLHDLFKEKKMSSEAHKEEEFLRCMQVQLRYFKEKLTDDRTSAAQLELVKEQSTSLLVFIQNLVEGHVTEHQEFLAKQVGLSRNVNLVKEVTQFYLALYHHIEDEISKLITDRNFQKHAPKVFGSGKQRFQLIAWHRDIDFAKLQLIMPMMLQALLTLAECCMGPCVSNQVTIVHENIPKTFPKLFAFFGALNLREVEKRGQSAFGGVSSSAFNGAPYKTPLHVPAIRHSEGEAAAVSSQGYANETELKDRVSENLSWDHQRNHDVRFNYIDSHDQKKFERHDEVSWVGNDPVLLFTLYRAVMKDEATYVDEHETKEALFGIESQGGGWIDQKKAFIAANEETFSYSKRGALRREKLLRHKQGGGQAEEAALFQRNLVRPQGDSEIRLSTNIYWEIEELTKVCLELEAGLLDFVAALIEGGDPEPSVVKTIVDNLDDGQLLFGNTVNWFRLRDSCESKGYNEKNLSRNMYKEMKAMASAYHILVKSLVDTKMMPAGFQAKYDALLEYRRIYPDKIIGRVELLGKDGLVNVMYYEIPEVVRTCWQRGGVQAKKHRILVPENNSLRSTPEEKLQNFFEETEELIAVIEHEYALHELRKSPYNAWRIIARIFQFNDLWSYVVLAFSLIINAVVLFEYEYKDGVHGDEYNVTRDGAGIWEYDDDNRMNDDDQWGGQYIGGGRNFAGAFLSNEKSFTDKLKPSFWNNIELVGDGHFGRALKDFVGHDVGILSILSFWHFVFCVLLLLSHIFGAGWLNMKTGLANEANDGQISLTKLWKKYAQITDERFAPWTTQRDMSLFGGGGDGGGGGSGGEAEVLVTVPLVLRVFYYSVLLDIEMLYYLVLAVVAFWAFWFGEEIIVALSILDIVRMSPSMQKIMRSFTKNISMVIFTLLFSLILLFIFVAWSFRRDYAYAFEDHNSCNDKLHPEGHCGGSMWDRLVLHIDYGLINPLIGAYEDDPWQWESWDAHTFGFLYYFLINLVASAIISGIIIDTFAEMRSDRKEVLEDLKTNCFVCDIEVVDFEQANHDFQQHITNEHNMWQYVWLKIYLRDTDPKDYKGLELHVAPLLLDHNKAARCMPIKRARAIQGNVKDKATLPTLLGKINRLLASDAAQTKMADELKHKVDTIHREHGAQHTNEHEFIEESFDGIIQALERSKGERT